MKKILLSVLAALTIVVAIAFVFDKDVHVTEQVHTSGIKPGG
jgi:uncharacterized membrane protein